MFDTSVDEFMAVEDGIDEPIAPVFVTVERGRFRASVGEPPVPPSGDGEGDPRPRREPDWGIVLASIALAMCGLMVASLEMRR